MYSSYVINVTISVASKLFHPEIYSFLEIDTGFTKNSGHMLPKKKELRRHFDEALPINLSVLQIPADTFQKFLCRP